MKTAKTAAEGAKETWDEIQSHCGPGVDMILWQKGGVEDGEIVAYLLMGLIAGTDMLHMAWVTQRKKVEVTVQTATLEAVKREHRRRREAAKR